MDGPRTTDNVILFPLIISKDNMKMPRNDYEVVVEVNKIAKTEKLPK